MLTRTCRPTDCSDWVAPAGAPQAPWSAAADPTGLRTTAPSGRSASVALNNCWRRQTNDTDRQDRTITNQIHFVRVRFASFAGEGGVLPAGVHSGAFFGAPREGSHPRARRWRQKSDDTASRRWGSRSFLRPLRAPYPCTAHGPHLPTPTHACRKHTMNRHQPIALRPQAGVAPEFLCPGGRIPVRPGQAMRESRHEASQPVASGFPDSPSPARRMDPARILPSTAGSRPPIWS
jgi:hypothetical protein